MGRRLAGVLVIAAALVAFSQVTPTHATDPGNGLGPKTLVGAWFVEVTPTQVPPFVSLGIFNSDGTLTNISSSSLIFPPESPGYGVWSTAGAHKFASTFFTIVGDGTGKVAATNKVRAIVTVDPSGDHFSGRFQVDIFDANGTLIASDTGTVQARRIKVEPL